jgi:hypothetical protein
MELVGLKSDSKVGYVPQNCYRRCQIMIGPASHRQVVPIRTEVTVLAKGVDAKADGNCVDWNSLELHKHTDLFIALMADT